MRLWFTASCSVCAATAHFLAGFPARKHRPHAAPLWALRCSICVLSIASCLGFSMVHLIWISWPSTLPCLLLVTRSALLCGYLDFSCCRLFDLVELGPPALAVSKSGFAVQFFLLRTSSQSGCFDFPAVI